MQSETGLAEQEVWRASTESMPFKSRGKTCRNGVWEAHQAHKVQSGSRPGRRKKRVHGKQDKGKEEDCSAGATRGVGSRWRGFWTFQDAHQSKLKIEVFGAVPRTKRDGLPPTLSLVW